MIQHRTYTVAERIERLGIVVVALLVIYLAFVGLLSITRGTPVQTVIAEALGRFGSAHESAVGLEVLLHYAKPRQNAFLSMAAWNSLDYLDERAKPERDLILSLSTDPKVPPPRYGDYAKRLKEETLEGLQ